MLFLPFLLCAGIQRFRHITGDKWCQRSRRPDSKYDKKLFCVLFDRVSPRLRGAIQKSESCAVVFYGNSLNSPRSDRFGREWSTPAQERGSSSRMSPITYMKPLQAYELSSRSPWKKKWPDAMIRRYQSTTGTLCAKSGLMNLPAPSLISLPE